MDKCCRLCKFYAELKKPFPVSDDGFIYGYCFKDGTKPYSPCLGKGYPVYIDEGACKAFKPCRKEKEGEHNVR